MQNLLDLRLLSTFVRAAHSGTLSATAIQVGRTQSTVTMQIQRLEETLGQALFHRSGSGVALTGAGERFLGYAERILRLHDEALSAFSDRGLRGSMVFGCPEDYLITFFPALLRGFGALHPDIEIRVVSAPTPELHRLLHARQIDMAIVSTPDDGDGQNIVRHEQLVWVGSRPTLDLPDFPGGIIPLAMPASNAMDHRMACDAMDGAGMGYKITYASNSLTGLIAVARSGLAISVMMQRAVPNDLHILKSPMPALPQLGLQVVTADTTARTPVITAFADHIRNLLPFL